MTKPAALICRPPYQNYAVLAVLIVLIGCSSREVVTPVSEPGAVAHPLSTVGFSIQVGAFSNPDNAARLTETLESHGLDAYHFVDRSGLYKVRFGDYPTRKAARRHADFLKKNGIIEEYYIVRPQRRYSDRRFRNKIVRTARNFLGVPYKWGGSDPEEGFDCSGLTMVVYRLNGLNLPRSSRQQWKVGVPVKRSQLLMGDLVFFATDGNKAVSHVGIYAGDGKFIHAPGRGKKIRTAPLSSPYYTSRYRGARRYL